MNNETNLLPTILLWFTYKFLPSFLIFLFLFHLLAKYSIVINFKKKKREYVKRTIYYYFMLVPFIHSGLYMNSTTNPNFKQFCFFARTRNDTLDLILFVSVLYMRSFFFYLSFFNPNFFFRKTCHFSNLTSYFCLFLHKKRGFKTNTILKKNVMLENDLTLFWVFHSYNKYLSSIRKPPPTKVSLCKK